ncbi:MAG: hypothetical protein MZV64_35060 [Ignavibacteriales bacterium]|nr:hypothetical protein [Ignavibacteriales bacterium]
MQPGQFGPSTGCRSCPHRRRCNSPRSGTERQPGRRRFGRRPGLGPGPEALTSTRPHGLPTARRRSRVRECFPAFLKVSHLPALMHIIVIP